MVRVTHLSISGESPRGISIFVSIILPLFPVVIFVQLEPIGVIDAISGGCERIGVVSQG